jgi:uncharacterized membrane protein
VTLALLIACSGASQDSEVSLCSSQPALSYTSFGKAFLDRYCTGCHSAYVPLSNRNGAPEGVDFESYEKVLLWRERIEARSLDLSMPPGGGPAEAELLQLEEWFGCAVERDAARLEAQ